MNRNYEGLWYLESYQTPYNDYDRFDEWLDAGVRIYEVKNGQKSNS